MFFLKHGVYMEMFFAQLFLSVQWRALQQCSP